MAEQRVGVREVRDGKDLKFGSSGETIAGEEVDSSAGDETSGESRDWKDLKFDSSGDKRSGEARDEKDLKFGDGGETADADEDVQKQDSIEFDDHSVDGFADDAYKQSWDGLGRNDDDFEPDTNRLDYFVVAPFDVAYGDDDLGEIGNYGGGGGGGGDTARILISSNNDSGDGDRNDRDMVVRPTLDQERASRGAGGQRLAVGISSNNGGGDGRRNREILLGQERGSSGGAGYMTQQDPIGISEQERGGGFEWWIGGGGLWEKLWLLLALWKIV